MRIHARLCLLVALSFSGGCEVLLVDAPAKERDAGTRTCACVVEGVCVFDTRSDPRACGHCGVACAPGELCVDGECGTGCADGEARCDGVCVDPLVEPAHCGGCGRACVGDCVAGECDGVRCEPGARVCDGACVDVASDPESCGDCGVRCGSDERCAGGECLPGCRSGLVGCGVECVDLSRDERHCGGCDLGCEGECGAGGRCDGVSCGEGERLCDESEGCVDVTSDPARCGSCGVACAVGEECAEGRCLGPCVEGRIRCGGECVDPMNDASHCGGCSMACDPNDECSGGGCVECPAGATACDGRCVDTGSDPAHCGGCDEICDGECAAGVCEPCPASAPDACGGTCLDTQRDFRACGACDTACAPGVICGDGACLCPVARSCGGACASDYNVEHCGGVCGAACSGYCGADGECAAFPPGDECGAPRCAGESGCPLLTYLVPDPLVGAHLVGARVICPETLTAGIARIACRTHGFAGGSVHPGDISDLPSVCGGAAYRLDSPPSGWDRLRLEDLPWESRTCTLDTPQVIKCGPPL